MNAKIGVDYARAFFGQENSGDYDRLVQLATIGQDSKWKKKIAGNIQANRFGLDLACGTGILSSSLLENGNIVIGVDLTFAYLKMFSSKGIQMNLINANAEMLPFVENTFDFIVTSYLPKYTNLDHLIFECYRVLKSGGCIVLHDFTLPRNSLYKFAWNIYYKIIRYAWKNNDKWKNVFDNLDSLIKQNRWDSRIEGILDKSGFSQIASTYLTFQTSLIVTAIKDDLR